MIKSTCFLSFAMSIVTVSLAATTGFREVITEDSFSMLNIIPSSPGREEVAAADGARSASRSRTALSAFPANGRATA
ncbi:MAG: hypothetical protein E7046_10305 [Lentisphaerae bacterium]|nr:hypothetical protein [Lentisphaerota bacterium]